MIKKMPFLILILTSFAFASITAMKGKKNAIIPRSPTLKMPIKLAQKADSAVQLTDVRVNDAIKELSTQLISLREHVQKGNGSGEVSSVIEKVVVLLSQLRLRTFPEQVCPTLEKQLIEIQSAAEARYTFHEIYLQRHSTFNHNHEVINQLANALANKKRVTLFLEHVKEEFPIYKTRNIFNTAENDE